MAQTKELAGKVAWVTGGGRGIGRSVALELAARGAAVVVTGRSEKHVAEVVGEVANAAGKARHLAADVRDPKSATAAVDLAISAFGGLDIVVACAGVSGRVPLGRGGDEGAGDLTRAKDILETNVMGVYYTFNAAAAKLREGGRLIALSSVLGKFGVPGYGAYCASKSGVLGLVRATAHEVASRKITCNAIVPGWVDTDMAKDGLREIAAATGGTEASAKAEAVKAFPLGRFIAPEEVARFVAFVASDAADAITGQALSMCGGATAFGA
jgi:NAD(P)-dependent dehydrogenase (short-subunit alcohol dehydrogenase family)